LTSSISPDLFYSKKSIIYNYIFRKSKSIDFFPSHFSNPDDYLKQINRLNEIDFDRDSLCDVLIDQNQNFGAGDNTFGNIKKLRREDAFVVIGGQQNGLFLGPLYALYKALTVIKLSKKLSNQTSKKIVPVFWIASDDHDFAEINHIHLPDSDAVIQKIVYNYSKLEDKLPVSDIPISSEIENIFNSIKNLLPETEFSTQLFEIISNSYLKNESFPNAFGKLMQVLLKKFGIILVDPSDKRLKKIAVPLFRREIEDRSPISSAVIEQSNIIKKQGFSTQLNLHDNILNIFYHNPQRETIIISDEKFEIKNSNVSFSENVLLEKVENNPEKFSPNAAMRPLYQDTIFPTLAFVLGPSELAYFAQLRQAYEDMKIPIPIAYPRISITLIEPKAERLLKKYQLSIEDIYLNKDKILDIILKRDIPDSLFSNIDQNKKQVEESWMKLSNEISCFDSNMIKPAEIAANKSLSQFDFLHKKLMQSARKKDEVVRSQVTKLLNLVYPLSKPQERVYNILPYYVRFGEQFIDTVYSQMDVFNHNHQIISLGTGQ